MCAALYYSTFMRIAIPNVENHSQFWYHMLSIVIPFPVSRHMAQGLSAATHPHNANIAGAAQCCPGNRVKDNRYIPLVVAFHITVVSCVPAACVVPVFV
jgi:hypothetical protein